MSYVMTSDKFIEKLKYAAQQCETIYIKGCFGAPMNEKNKKRYSSNTAYNKKRKEKIYASTDDTFGFDCVCLIKGILWGWNGDKNKVYGGAAYASDGVPDITESAMISKCGDVSTDFNLEKMLPGEMLWMSGHAGVYIGDGLAVECTPAWADSVQITSCNCDIDGYHRRNWKKHGKLPWIDYGEEVYAPTVLEWQIAADADGFNFPKYGFDGKWGNECISVAKKAIVKKRIFYRYPNLTKIVQKVVGVDADGKCGKNTQSAIMKFQLEHGLVPDGEVGLTTWQEILNIK